MTVEPSDRKLYTKAKPLFSIHSDTNKFVEEIVG